MKNLSWLVLVCLCSSCVSYRHSWTNPDGSIDKTGFGSFMMKGEASKVRTTTKLGTNYNRTVNLGTASGSGDSEMIQAITSGIVEGLKKSQGIP